MARASTATAGKGAKRAGPTRRTQAERSAETRRKIIDATIACMAEDGVRQTTMARIAERAGVTWGAIQHHFGDKAAIVFAGVQQVLDDIGEGVARLAVPGDTLRERVHRVIQNTWAIGYDGAAQRRSMQVMITTIAELKDGDATRAHVERLNESFDRVWRSLFADFDLPEERLALAERFAFAVMSGLNLGMLQSGRVAPVTEELTRLEGVLVDILSAST